MLRQYLPSTPPVSGIGIRDWYQGLVSGIGIRGRCWSRADTQRSSPVTLFVQHIPGGQGRRGRQCQTDDRAEDVTDIYQLIRRDSPTRKEPSERIAYHQRRHESARYEGESAGAPGDASTPEDVTLSRHVRLHQSPSRPTQRRQRRDHDAERRQCRCAPAGIARPHRDTMGGCQ